MTRYGMLIDTRRCVECFACRVACERHNGLTSQTPLIRYEEFETGAYPDVFAETVTIQCMHCSDAPCVPVCPTGATHIDDDGVVRIDRDSCIGCRQCMVACPYGARVFDRATNTVDKCRLCAVDYLPGSDREGEANCTCVAACMVGARIVGDLDDPDSEISKAIAERGAAMLVDGVTQAKVYYVRG